MNREPKPCRACARFIPDAQLRKDEDGPGYCEGYEKLRRHDETNEACVLFNRAKDEAKRRAWAEQQKHNKKGLEK